MSQNGQTLSEKKDALEKEITSALLDAVERQQLPLAKLQLTAREILNEFLKVNTVDGLSTFIDNARKKWNYLSHLSLAGKGQEVQTKEKEVMNKLSKYIRTLH